MNRRALAAAAIARALDLRSSLGHGPDASLCPFDIAERIGVDVRFRADAPSLEGIYDAERRVIVLNAERPAGRRRYTCSHELGHHAHDHGTSVDGPDDLVADKTNEFVANQFGRALLMPKLAVSAAFTRRGWMPRTTNATQAFVVAQDLGVGFTSLLDHMSQSLNLLDRATAERIGKTRLPTIRQTFTSASFEHDLFPIDVHWGSRPLDLEAGDVAIVPGGTSFEGVCAKLAVGVLLATTPGLGELNVPGRTSPISVRVSRREFVGANRYRHLEEADDE